MHIKPTKKKLLKLLRVGGFEVGLQMLTRIGRDVRLSSCFLVGRNAGIVSESWRFSCCLIDVGLSGMHLRSLSWVHGTHVNKNRRNNVKVN